MTQEFLDRDELHHLTGKKTRGRQIDALITMGVSFHVRPDGHAVVSRSQFRDHSTAHHGQEPNWDALRVTETEKRKS